MVEEGVRNKEGRLERALLICFHAHFDMPSIFRRAKRPTKYELDCTGLKARNEKSK